MLTVTTATSLPPPQYSYQPCHNGSSPLNTFSTARSLQPQEKKKNSNRPTCPSKDTLSWTLIPSRTSKWQELQRGKKKKMWLEQISSMKASAQEEFYLHQRLPKPTWHFFFRAGRRAGRYSHLGFPQLVPVARASARSSGALSHGPVLCIECVNQSLNILYYLRSLSKHI